MDIYNRELAVDYARRWWDARNPAFPSFTNDCTNFISQCLLAGQLPMEFSIYRNQGWWINSERSNWSFSWSVSHSLRWYLLSSGRGIEVGSVYDLTLGDIIFYDFNGDGTIQHSTIITSVIDGEPYIHAHTSDSEDRHWLYENSTAYTPNIRYYFMKIVK